MTWRAIASALGERAVGQIGPAVVGALGGLPKLRGVAAMQRLQGHVLAANGDAGGQWAGGRVDLWPNRWGPRWGHGGVLGFMG